MDKFYYKKGPIEVTRPWQRPTWDKFLQWQKDFFKIDGVEKYKVGMWGNFWNNIPTWDIDIAISENSTNYKEIENILITGTNIGFKKYNILIDLRWLSNLEMDVTKDKLIQQKKIKRLLIWKEIWKNGKRIGYVPNAIQIRKNLWQSYILIPGQKHINRIMSGQEYKKPVLLPIYER